MPKQGTLVDHMEAPSKSRTSARKAEYDALIRPFIENSDKVFVVELDDDETAKGVGLALVYAAERAGVDAKAWETSDGKVALRKATEAEMQHRKAMRDKRANEKNGGSDSPKVDTGPGENATDKGAEQRKTKAMVGAR